MLTPVTSTRSPETGGLSSTLFTNTPPLASWTKYLPRQFGSAVVTTPVRETFKPRAARSGESAKISEALVKTSSAEISRRETSSAAIARNAEAANFC